MEDGELHLEVGDQNPCGPVKNLANSPRKKATPMGPAVLRAAQKTRQALHLRVEVPRLLQLVRSVAEMTERLR